MSGCMTIGGKESGRVNSARYCSGGGTVARKPLGFGLAEVNKNWALITI
jgi:hypothetical protein